MNRDSILAGEAGFFSSRASRLALSPKSTSGRFTENIKRPEREVEHLPPSGVDVKSVWR
jgi:hypothetical protein